MLTERKMETKLTQILAWKNQSSKTKFQFQKATKGHGEKFRNDTVFLVSSKMIGK